VIDVHLGVLAGQEIDDVDQPLVGDADAEPGIVEPGRRHLEALRGHADMLDITCVDVGH
jgi:hypothetical protein